MLLDFATDTNKKQQTTPQNDRNYTSYKVKTATAVVITRFDCLNIQNVVWSRRMWLVEGERVESHKRFNRWCRGFSFRARMLFPCAVHCRTLALCQEKSFHIDDHDVFSYLLMLISTRPTYKLLVRVAHRHTRLTTTREKNEKNCHTKIRSETQ